MFDPIPSADTVLLLTMCLATAGVAYYLERLSILGRLPLMLARKFLHIFAIGLCCVAAAVVQNVQFLMLLVLLAELFLLYLVVGRNYFSIDGRKSWGILYFPISFLVLLALFPHDRFLIVAPMGLMALADAAATIIGEKYAPRFFILTGDTKSITGAMAFIVVGFLWFFFLGFFGYGTGQSWTEYLVMALSVTLVTAGTELIGSNGRDNLWVPISSAFLLWAVFHAPVPVNVFYLLLFILVFTGGALLAVRLHLLSWSGALAAVLVGIGIVSIGHFSVWPMLLFFVSGSLLGKLPGRKATDEKAGQARDSKQVFANSITAWILAHIHCIWPDEKWIWLYLVSVACCNADTWSSELGVRLGHKPIDLLRWKKLPPGISGAVSLPGMLAALAGASVIAIFSGSWEPAWKIALLGFAGSLMDSLLGSALQARYVYPNGALSDTPATDTLLLSGNVRVSNDAVNVLSTLLVTLSAAFIL